jgi:ribosome recycling factor
MVMDDVKEVLSSAENRMQQSLVALSRELGHLRAGRANSTLVDHVKVDAYDSSMPLSQLATVTTPDATMIMISPYDKNLTGAIEKAINLSDLGLMPQSDGSLIRLNVPPLTEERRTELLKVVRKYGEDGRVALRNVRRDANEQIKKLEKAKDISEDEMHHYLEKVDKILEEQLKALDQQLDSKQQEISEF